MAARKLKAILFDLDGTLIDTERNAAEAVMECFRGWKILLEPSDAVYVTGRTWESAFEYLFGKYTLPIPTDEAAQAIRLAYRHSIEKNLIRVPGSAEAVKDLAQSYRLAVISGSSRSDILWALQSLGVLGDFEFVLGSEDYPRSKPAPDGYQKAISLMRIEADEALIFEDSTPGIQSGISAGCRVVAITGTNHFSQNTSLAHEQISDLTRVNCAWIEELMRRLQK